MRLGGRGVRQTLTNADEGGVKANADVSASSKKTVFLEMYFIQGRLFNVPSPSNDLKSILPFRKQNRIVITYGFGVPPKFTIVWCIAQNFEISEGFCRFREATSETCRTTAVGCRPLTRRASAAASRQRQKSPLVSKLWAKP